MINGEKIEQINALLLIGPGCPHCASLLEVLSKLIKQGELSQLEIVNVAKSPETAQQLAVRSVPWFRLGEFEFDGAYTEGEIRDWLKIVASKNGASVYFRHLLNNGKLPKVIAMVKAKPDFMHDLVFLAMDTEKSMKEQLGVSAVFEDLEGSELLQRVVDDLGDMAGHPNAVIRADGAHYLSLTHSQKARSYLQQLLQDDNKEVKEIAQEALHTLSDN